MSILDRVYTTFKRLDQDFARSKKSRSEFIIDKFGGDINIGSIIILDAIHAEGLEESPENIEKMSFVKDTFAAIQACADHLDSLTSFAFTDTNVVSSFVDILAHADQHLSRQVRTSQKALWANGKKAIHYCCDAEQMLYADPDSCTVFHCFNENMAGLLASGFKLDRELQLGAYYRGLPGLRLKLIQGGAVSRYVK